MIGFKKAIPKPKLEEPKKQRLGDYLAGMNRAGRRKAMASLKKHFKQRGQRLV